MKWEMSFQHHSDLSLLKRQSAKTRPGADCGSDHELLIAKFRLKLKKVGKTTRPFRYPRGTGSAAGRPRPQPNLGCELSRRSWEQAPFSFQGHPRPGYPARDPPPLQLPRLAGPSTLLHSTGCRPVLPEMCSGEQPRFFPPAVRRLVEGPPPPPRDGAWEMVASLGHHSPGSREDQLFPGSPSSH